MFRQIAPLLAAKRLVMAPDRLGLGCSDHPAEPPSVSDYAMATVAALHGLRIDMFDVVGVHTGSTDAVELATAYPDRVSRIAAEV